MRPSHRIGGQEEVLIAKGISRRKMEKTVTVMAVKRICRVAFSATLLSLETTDYQIDGRPGNWLAAEEAWIDGRQFFLMQSQELSYMRQAVFYLSGKAGVRSMGF